MPKPTCGHAINSGENPIRPGVTSGPPALINDFSPGETGGILASTFHDFDLGCKLARHPGIIRVLESDISPTRLVQCEIARMYGPVLGQTDESKRGSRIDATTSAVPSDEPSSTTI